MGDNYSASPWDNFTTIVADTLGIESRSIDPSNSYQEMGGTSLNIVAAVLHLQESGFPVTIEQFMAAGSMEKLFLTATANPGVTATGHHFTVKPLGQVEKRMAQQLLGESFLSKNDLSKCGNMAMEDFVFAYDRWWDMFQEYSLVVLDEEGRLRAVALVADQNTADQHPPDASIHTHLRNIFSMLTSATKKVKTNLNPTGKIGVVLCKFIFGASLENTPEENVTAFTLIETELMETARKNGFLYTIAENSSPLTQQLSEYLGCKRHVTLQVNQWKDSEGHYPFAACDANCTLTIDVYEVRK